MEATMATTDGLARVASVRAEVGATPPWREARVADVTLAYDDEGAGPVLLCLHAIGHGARDYAALRARYRGRFRVVALDWPGHGRSQADGHPVSAAHYARALEGFVDALGLERFTLLGNSIGGAAAIRYTAAHPERVAALVVANPGGLVPSGWTTRAFTGLMARFFEAGAAGARWYPRAFAALYRRLLRGPDAAAQRARIVAAGVESAPVLAQAWRSFGEPEADLREQAARIACPVLVAWSTLDPVNPLRFNLDGVRRFPRARLERFRAGHSAFLEVPEAFDAAFDRFLAEGA